MGPTDTTACERSPITFASLAIVATLAVGCTAANPAFIDPADPPRAPEETSIEQGTGIASMTDQPVAAGKPHVPPLAATDSCAAGAFLGCEGEDLFRCASDGSGPVVESCGSLGCNAAAERCNGCVAGSAPTCAGNTRVTCAGGIRLEHPCPYGCHAGACKGCPLRAFYLDLDGDGFGEPGQTSEQCAPAPEGFATNDDDCDDGDPDAFVGQTAFFGRERESGGHDFNCDDVQERRYTRFARCISRSPSDCKGGGWLISVPRCGVKGLFVTCHLRGSACEPASLEMRTQGCR